MPTTPCGMNLEHLPEWVVRDYLQQHKDCEPSCLFSQQREAIEVRPKEYAAVLSVRLNDEQMRHLEFLRKAQHASASVVVRRLIDDAPWVVVDTTLARPA